LNDWHSVVGGLVNLLIGNFLDLLCDSDDLGKLLFGQAELSTFFAAAFKARDTISADGCTHSDKFQFFL